MRDITPAVHLLTSYPQVALLLSPARGTVHLVPLLVSHYHDVHYVVYNIV